MEIVMFRIKEERGNKAGQSVSLIYSLNPYVVYLS